MNTQPGLDGDADMGIATHLRQHPGLRGKTGLGLVTEILGPTDWVSGPGDDAAAIACLSGGGEAFVLAAGEAIFPPFVRADPYQAGIAAVVTNVNDIAAMGGRPAGIVDTIVAAEESARLILQGLKAAAGLYDVPVVGGHLTLREDCDPSLSAFAVGHARRPLSATNVTEGQALLLACCTDGRMRDDFPFFSSLTERGHQLAGDVRVLAGLADEGHCTAAKDVSMAGLLGSLAMLLEPTGCGAAIDLAAIPRPAGVPLTRWLGAFPLYAFLLCAPPEQAGSCRQTFRDRDLACEQVGRIDATGRLRAITPAGEVSLLDLARDRVTGLARPVAAHVPG
jgi:selenophosphate synthetase-related protein